MQTSHPIRRVVRPLDDFISTEVLSGLVLLGATLTALIWANSPAGDSYVNLWSTQLSISLGTLSLDLDLKHWINDGLMAIFFFVVGLEIKRELVEGELRDPRRAALPVIGAIGGMVIPAAIYLAVTASGPPEAGHGWGIPMATDIAMALAVLSLLSKRVPATLKLFLLALAIVDDIGAILVIAVFYSAGIQFHWLGLAAALLAFLFMIRQLGLQWRPVYVVVAVAFWFAVHETGVHATIAGVLLAFAAPTRPIRPAEYVDTDKLVDIGSVHTAHETATLARQSVSVVEWLVHILHPWTSFLILPLFALANAGVALSSSDLQEASTSVVTLGVVAGLVLGKTLGISAAIWIACKLGVAERPEGVTWAQIVAISSLAGIGFTVALFITELAFVDQTLVAEAKIGVLAASLTAGLIGYSLLRFTSANKEEVADPAVEASH